MTLKNPYYSAKNALAGVAFAATLAITSPANTQENTPFQTHNYNYCIEQNITPPSDEIKTALKNKCKDIIWFRKQFFGETYKGNEEDEYLKECTARSIAWQPEDKNQWCQGYSDTLQHIGEETIRIMDRINTYLQSAIKQTQGDKVPKEDRIERVEASYWNRLLIDEASSQISADIIRHNLKDERVGVRPRLEQSEDLKQAKIPSARKELFFWEDDPSLGVSQGLYGHDYIPGIEFFDDVPLSLSKTRELELRISWPQLAELSSQGDQLSCEAVYEFRTIDARMDYQVKVILAKMIGAKNIMKDFPGLKESIEEWKKLKVEYEEAVESRCPDLEGKVFENGVFGDKNEINRYN